MNFVAIDFETAHNDASSVCAAGLAVVQNCSIVKTFYSLVRPLQEGFCPRLVKIHGITEDMVEAAPSFEEIYAEIIQYIGNGPLVAHNAAFDMRVLIQSLQQIDQPVPEIAYFCTLQLCRTLLPELPNHRLGTISRLLKIPIEHHNALSDAIACAQIAIRLHQTVKLNPQMKKLNDHAEIGSIEVIDSFRKKILLENLAPEISFLLDSFKNHVFANNDSRFKDMRFVLTGEMDLLKREQAIAVIEYFGGRVTTAVSKKTDFLVVGCDEWDIYSKTGNAKTNKLKRAVEFQNQGYDIQVLNQFDFFEKIK